MYTTWGLWIPGDKGELYEEIPFIINYNCDLGISKCNGN